MRHACYQVFREHQLQLLLFCLYNSNNFAATACDRESAMEKNPASFCNISILQSELWPHPAWTWLHVASLLNGYVQLHWSTPYSNRSLKEMDRNCCIKYDWGTWAIYIGASHCRLWSQFFELDTLSEGTYKALHWQLPSSTGAENWERLNDVYSSQLHFVNL